MLMNFSTFFFLGHRTVCAYLLQVQLKCAQRVSAAIEGIVCSSMLAVALFPTEQHECASMGCSA
jgi:hypothetical protein